MEEWSVGESNGQAQGPVSTRTGRLLTGALHL